MKYIQGENRKQSVIFPQTLDQIVDQDNDVECVTKRWKINALKSDLLIGKGS